MPPEQISAHALQSWASSKARQVFQDNAASLRDSAAQPVLQATSTGVVVIELFGGLCAGLEACLRNGWVVSTYAYADNDPQVRLIAAHRLHMLHQQYPSQLPLHAFQHSLDCLPHNVKDITPAHLTQFTQQLRPVILWAGWECQDLSGAGSGRGSAGSRSSTFFPLLDIVKHLQSALGSRFAYFLENVAMVAPWQRSPTVIADYHRINTLVGHPPVARTLPGSVPTLTALGTTWTNLAPQPLLQQAIYAVTRPRIWLVDSILDPNRQSQTVFVSDQSPLYPCILPGQVRLALPTLMATVGSYNFVPGAAGSIWGQEPPSNGLSPLSKNENVP
jgi:hypothetical protein